VEFVVNLYVFPLAVELLLVPLVAVVVMIGAVAETKPGFTPVRKLIEGLLVAFGLFLLVRATLIVVSDVESFATSGNVLRFVLPPMLSLALFPFNYVLAIYAIYEVTFIRLPYLLKDERLVPFAKCAMLRSFHLRFRPLRRFAAEGAAKLLGARDRRDVLAVIERFA
jgi:hypothetical protein